MELLAKEMAASRCDILGIAESHRLGTEDLTIGNYRYIGQGCYSDVHQSGVGILLNKTVQPAVVEFIPTTHI